MNARQSGPRDINAHEVGSTISRKIANVGVGKSIPAARRLASDTQRHAPRRNGARRISDAERELEPTRARLWNAADPTGRAEVQSDWQPPRQRPEVRWPPACCRELRSVRPPPFRVRKMRGGDPNAACPFDAARLRRDPKLLERRVHERCHPLRAAVEQVDAIALEPVEMVTRVQVPID